MTFRVLIMGLPTSGKTTLARELVDALNTLQISTTWFNADEIREKYNDWDFSIEGRLRQSKRLRELADSISSDIAVCDFVAPLVEMREIYDANLTVWVDTITESNYTDTNKLFVIPKYYDLRVTTKDSKKWAPVVISLINNVVFPPSTVL